MPQKRGFYHLKAAARDLNISAGDLKRADLRNLLCRDCDFYDDDHEDELECSCFIILCHLLKTGRLTPQGLSASLPGDGEGGE